MTGDATLEAMILLASFLPPLPLSVFSLTYPQNRACLYTFRKVCGPGGAALASAEASGQLRHHRRHEDGAAG